MPACSARRAGSDGVEADFQRHFGAVAPQPVQVAPDTHVARLALRQHLLHLRRMRRPCPRRHQFGNRQTGERAGRVAKQGFGLGVGQRDVAHTVHQQHGVGCQGHHQRKTGLRLLVSGLGLQQLRGCAKRREHAADRAVGGMAQPGVGPQRHPPALARHDGDEGLLTGLQPLRHHPVHRVDVLPAWRPRLHCQTPASSCSPAPRPGSSPAPLRSVVERADAALAVGDHQAGADAVQRVGQQLLRGLVGRRGLSGQTGPATRP
jgi:hypothetical protein